MYVVTTIHFWVKFISELTILLPEYKSTQNILVMHYTTQFSRDSLHKNYYFVIMYLVSFQTCMQLTFFCRTPMKSETERMEVIGVQNNIGHQKKNCFYSKAIEELFFSPKEPFIEQFFRKTFLDIFFCVPQKKAIHTGLE